VSQNKGSEAAKLWREAQGGRTSVKSGSTGIRRFRPLDNRFPERASSAAATQETSENIQGDQVESIRRLQEAWKHNVKELPERHRDSVVSNVNLEWPPEVEECIGHLRTGVSTLYGESARAGNSWVENILVAGPFQVRIIAESVFGNPTTFEQLMQKPPALVALSTMSRALTALREGTIGSRTLGRAITHARVNCVKSFVAPENTDYAHQRLVAVGTEDGVYIGYIPETSGLCTLWTKVLSLLHATQIDVIDEFGIFLVLASGELIAYSLSSIVPQLPLDSGSVAYSLPQRRSQRLSGSHSVGFFATGKLKGRMLVIYKENRGVRSIFKAMEPVVGKPDLNLRKFFRRKNEFFRDYDVCHD
jgi:CNH domain